MQIWVELIFVDVDSKIISLEIDSGSKLSQIKNMIPYGEMDQNWYFDSVKMADDFSDWISSNIYKIFIKEKWFDIYLIANNKKHLVRMVKSSYSVYDLKLRIFDQVKIIPPKVSLIFRNELLKDNQILAGLNIGPNSEIKLVLNLKSG